ncbi:hypothetical protein GOV12_05475 [Candidatus Pacearchaeota archaeon]|nr:hypothetical protein [Candidatus Pacearchaeota archaeon]
MVKTKHFCEWPDCGRDHPTYEQAVECESQGFVGPDIKPGLVRKTRTSYVLFTGCKNNGGHDRISETINFFYNGKSGIYGINEDFLSPITLETEVSNGRLTALSGDELEKLREPVEARFKQELNGFTLYREHQFFDERE